MARNYLEYHPNIILKKLYKYYANTFQKVLGIYFIYLKIKTDHTIFKIKNFYFLKIVMIG